MPRQFGILLSTGKHPCIHVKTLAVSQAGWAITRAVIACRDRFFPRAHFPSEDISWPLRRWLLRVSKNACPNYSCGVFPSIVQTSMKHLRCRNRPR